MDPVVDTTTASVKMSDSFDTSNFTSSEDEEENYLGTSRANAYVSYSNFNSSDTLFENNPIHSVSRKRAKGNILAPRNSIKTSQLDPSQHILNSTVTHFPTVAQSTLTPTNSSFQQCPDSDYSSSGSNNTPLTQLSIDNTHQISVSLKEHSQNVPNESSEKSVTKQQSCVLNLNNEHDSTFISKNTVTENKSTLHSEIFSSSSSPVMYRNKTESNRDQNGEHSLSSLTSSCSSLKDTYHESRFNPFDRDILMEEDHFSDNPDKNLFCTGSSPRSLLSLTSTSSGLETSGIVTLAELGLAEDHFSHPEGHFGLSRTEELEQAIENCKELIVMAAPQSDRQKNLVLKLIQLRLKLQEIKEGPESVEADVTVVMGHHLKRKESHSSKYYCEKCNSIIWGLMQEWRRCLYCGYRCHDKCVPLITRTCAQVKVKDNPTYILELCPRNPKGLAAQDFRCAECRTQISGSEGSEARLCEYNGRYYCELCHWNDLVYIPARILHNWDFEKQKVCRASKQFLKLMQTKAVIRVQDVNPMLFNYVEQLNEIKRLREEILIMKKYILACPTAMESKLLLQLSSKPHFVECSDRYSLQDLLDSDDILIPSLVQVHSSWAQHIRTDCQLCQGRGYICELCKISEVLFPFDEAALVCSRCSNVTHRICFTQRDMCPRCERRSKRQIQEGSVT